MIACSQPPPPSDDQISVALDGEAEQLVHEHLARCVSCRERFNAAKGLEAGLRAALFTWDCPPPERLADYTLGWLGADEAVQIEAHMAVCAACTEEVEALQRLLSSAESTRPAVSPRLPTRPAPPPPIVARLLAPSTGPALRGDTPLPLIAETATVAVVLQIRPQADGSVALIGQVVAEDQARWDQGLVEARQGDEVQSLCLVNAQGGFSCALPSQAPIDLRIVAAGEAPILIAQIVAA